MMLTVAHVHSLETGMSSSAAGPHSDDDADGPAAIGAGQRLDKWLWFVRVIKTRTQAAGLVTDGKVRVNRIRVEKPSQTVRPGDVVTVSVRGHIRVLKMISGGQRRGPPPEARLLYEDLTPPPPPGADRNGGATRSGVREPGEGRPTKRDRRLLDRLRDRGD